jgi:hypothetical protein
VSSEYPFASLDGALFPPDFESCCASNAAGVIAARRIRGLHIPRIVRRNNMAAQKEIADRS